VAQPGHGAHDELAQNGMRVLGVAMQPLKQVEVGKAPSEASWNAT